MSDTDAMIALMDHAAKLLDLAGILIAERQGHLASAEVATTSAAIATGATTLRMVAASVAPDTDTRKSRALIAAIWDPRAYDAWAAERDELALTDGERASVGRFLRARLDGSSTERSDTDGPR